jgi:hypothetical protein
MRPQKESWKTDISPMSWHGFSMLCKKQQSIHLLSVHRSMFSDEGVMLAAEEMIGAY